MSKATQTLHVRSINHHVATTEIRELAHLDPTQSVALMACLLECDECISVLPVSTCNRTEIYLETVHGADIDKMLYDSLTTIGRNPEVFNSDFALRLDGLEAIRHLFRICSGLESMMLGEPQIVGQLKDAYRLARKHYEPGPGLLRAFQGAFRAGKRVRTETRITNGAVSVAFAAVELARKFFTNLSDHKALLVGAGETGTLAARHFLQHNIGELIVINRSPEKAAELVTAMNVERSVSTENPKSGCGKITSRPWSELASSLTDVDVILSTTGALEPIILPEMVKAAVDTRKGNPLFLLDIAVPRDIHPEVSDISGAFSFGLDDLDEIIAGNVAARESQIPHADRIIQEELDDFQSWLDDIDLRPTVAEFKAYLEGLKDKQVGYVRKKQNDEVAAAVDSSLKQFIKKVLGQSVSTLKQSESQEERQQNLDALRRIFSTENGENQPTAKPIAKPTTKPTDNAGINKEDQPAVASQPPKIKSANSD